MRPLRVFKFGGASVKDAEAVRNVASLLTTFHEQDIFVVISAMGKMTNAFEKLTEAYLKQDPAVSSIYSEIRAFHQTIIWDLLESESDDSYEEIDNLFLELECLLETPPESDYDYTYDQLVPFGELISTRIVSAYLNKHGIKNRWMDCRNFICTDNHYREARVDWLLTGELIQRKLLPMVRKQMIVTQGFVGRSADLTTTTLGRDGSDYSAAIFGSCLEADDVVIWKDVPGLMNADPKKQTGAKVIPHISFRETIELAYYGANVIHPKTIQPLQKKNIPLRVKDFTHIHEPGTEIDTKGPDRLEGVVSIYKENQILIHIKSEDLMFITEEPLSLIFQKFGECRIRINLMHNSAVSFSVCVDYDPIKMEWLKEKLSSDFELEFQGPVSLLTLRVFDKISSEIIPAQDRILLRNATDKMEQFVLIP